MLELAKTSVLLTVAIVSGAWAYDILDQHDLDDIIVAALAVGLTVVTGLPGIRRIRRYFKD